MESETQHDLKRLLADLPEELGTDIGEQARFVLRLFVEAALASPAASRIATEPSLCPNCGEVCGSTRSPYCSPLCREMSSFVRQFRACLPTEKILVPDKQIAFAQSFWRLIGGGLPYRNSLILPRALQRLFEKHDGKCAACGAPATTVDHIGTFCNRPSNLRPMCDGCAVTRPFGDARVLAKGRERTNELAARVAAPVAVRACDDPDAWDWRAFLVLRNAPQ